MVSERASDGESRPRQTEQTVTTFAVDDEPLARRQIALLVEQVPWVHHLGEASGRFLRLHRSHIANLDYVKRMVPFDSKRLQVELRDGTPLLASRSSSEMLRRQAR